MKQNIKRNSISFEIIGIILLAIYSLTILFAIWLMINTSLKSIIDYTLSPLTFPNKFRFDNYSKAIEQLYVNISTQTGKRSVMFFELLSNSLIYVLACTVVSMYTHFVCAYAAAKYPCFITKLMHWIVVVVLSFPVVGDLSSTMVLFQRTGVYNNRLLYILYCGGFTGTNFLIFYAACKGINNAYLEAARLDGASNYRILFSIAFPMAKSIITGMALLSVIALWNDWNTPMMWLPSYPTISYALYRFQFNTANSVSQIPARLAGCVIVMLPTLVIFLIFKNKFIGNIAVGGIKG